MVGIREGSYGYAILNYSDTPFLTTDTEGAIKSVPVFWHAVSVLG